MSVLVKGLAMDFIRQERSEMAITGIWPASVRTIISFPHAYIRFHLISSHLTSIYYLVHRICRNRIQQIGR
jgi:hypothetical protein